MTDAETTAQGDFTSCFNQLFEPRSFDSTECLIFKMPLRLIRYLDLNVKILSNMFWVISRVISFCFLFSCQDGVKILSALQKRINRTVENQSRVKKKQLLLIFCIDVLWCMIFIKKILVPYSTLIIKYIFYGMSLCLN